MARPLQDFINVLQTKSLRFSNMWELDITTGYSDVDSKMKNITMYAEGFDAPSRSQSCVDVYFKGYPLKVPSKIEMAQEHNITVRCDVNGDTRRMFLKWMNYISDAAISQGSYFGGEKRIPKNAFIRLRMLAMDMTTVLETYKLYGCIPINVGDIKLAHQDANVVTFEVKFNSQYWEVESSKGDFTEQK